jgi:hypothetical protein
VTPVAGVKEILAKEDPKLAQNDLIFPDENYIADCVPFTEPPGDAEDVQEVEEAWNDVIGG